MPTLFDPLTLGAIEVPNRIFMAPLTRGRATREHVPTPIMAEYYAQRASAGLIISEATGITQTGLGWAGAPGIWSDAQTAGWRVITDAVHRAGGRILSQLWHMGRLVHPSFMSGATPISASATRAPGKAHTYDGPADYAEARALEPGEIPQLLETYRIAATNAREAGFDGVEVHAANGYLIDQFLRDGTNRRTDRYGGSIDNRIRLLREVVETVLTVWEPGRVGVRLSPNGEIQGVDDSDPRPLFVAAAAALQALGIAYLHLREPGRDGTFGKADHDPIAPSMRTVFTSPMVLNSDYDRERGEAAIEEDKADAIAFGRTFLANPDLPYRFAHDLALQKDDPKTWYTPGPEGYTDYPSAA